MRKTLGLLLVPALAASAAATEWHVYGARAVGMGGAGVAVAQGPVGHYWNPAGLGQAENPSGLAVPFGFHADVAGPVIEGANDLNEIGKACDATPGAGLCTAEHINAALGKVGAPDSGIRADAGLGVAVKIKRLTVFVNGLAYVGGFGTADTVNTAAAATLNETNNSRVTLRGLQATEIGAGYGRELPWVPGLLVGGNLKIISGRAGYEDYFVFREDAGDNSLFSKFNNRARRSVQPGVDLGVLWDMNKTLPVPFRPRVGLTARNVNNPKFKNPDHAVAAGEPDKFSLQGQTRLGLALSPLRFWTIAMDADLSRNLTPLNGVASQMVSLGTEINVFNRDWLNIPLRGGLSRNVAEKGSKTNLALGAGLNFLHVAVDLSAMWSPSTQKVQSEGESKKFPSSFTLGTQLSIVFGGGKEDPKKS